MPHCVVLGPVTIQSRNRKSVRMDDQPSRFHPAVLAAIPRRCCSAPALRSPRERPNLSGLLRPSRAARSYTGQSNPFSKIASPVPPAMISARRSRRSALCGALPSCVPSCKRIACLRLAIEQVRPPTSRGAYEERPVPSRRNASVDGVRTVTRQTSSAVRSMRIVGIAAAFTWQVPRIHFGRYRRWNRNTQRLERCCHSQWRSMHQ